MNDEIEVQDAEVAPQEVVEEKMLPQSQVNKIAAREARDAYERGKRETLAEIQRQQAQSQQPQQQNQQTAMQGMSEDTIRRMIAEQAQEHANMALANQTANEFVGKLRAVAPKYEDFDDVIRDLNLPEIPHVVKWANSLDNTAEVMYDIGKNPEKFANILTLAQTSPALAERAMKKLSDSIKRNAQAQSADLPSEPLNQFQSSNLSNANTNVDSMSLNDLKQASWLRG